MTARCVATNVDGARCVYRADHGNGNHLYPDDPAADSFHLGKLQGAVRGFLERGSSREFLATILAETEADR